MKARTTRRRRVEGARSLDARTARRLLDGEVVAPRQHESLVRLLAHARAGVTLVEPSAQADAAARFRAAAQSWSTSAPHVVDLTTRASGPGHRAVSQRRDLRASAMPLVGSVVAVAACAALGVFVYTVNVDPAWSTRPVGGSSQPVGGAAEPVPGVGRSAAPVTRVPGAAGAGQAVTRATQRPARGTGVVSGGSLAVGEPLPGRAGRQSVAGLLTARPVPAASDDPAASPSPSPDPSVTPTGSPSDPSSGATQDRSPQQPLTSATSDGTSGAATGGVFGGPTGSSGVVGPGVGGTGLGGPGLGGPGLGGPGLGGPGFVGPGFGGSGAGTSSGQVAGSAEPAQPKVATRGRLARHDT